MIEAKPHDVPALTGLRGVAALWVFLYHVYKSFAGDGARLFTNDAIPFLREGWRGVDLFFILSGFVIAHVHLRDFERLSLSRVRSYAQRRFWRVYPLNAFWHLAVVALFLAAPAVLTAQPRYNPASVTPEAFAYGVLLIQTWVPGYTSAWNWPSWSLSAEIAAYLLFPIIALGVNRVRLHAHAWALAALMIVGLGLLLHLRGKLSVNAADLDALLRAVLCFAAGAAICRALAIRPVGETSANRIAACGLGLAALGSASVHSNFLWVPASALLIAAASAERGLSSRILSGQTVRRLGEVSFSLYLSHWPVVLVLRAELLERGTSTGVVFAAGALLATFLATTIITYLSWRYVEAPMHRLGRSRERPARPKEV